MTNVNYQITRATAADANEVLALWNSQIGMPGCTWSLEYPSWENVQHDLNNAALWVLRVGGSLAGVVAIGDPGDVGDLGWDLTRPAGLARLAVSREFQGQGLAAVLISHALQTARNQGYDGVILLVSPGNPRAEHLYQKFGFQADGETFNWGHLWVRYQLAFQ